MTDRPTDHPHTAVVVGNPKPDSRTLRAATTLAASLTGREPDLVVDLAIVGPALLDWSDPEVARLVAEVGAADLVVVASPTYKGTYTGLLKLFLDRIGGGALAATTAVPLMLGGNWQHSLAPEVFLKPVLAELGASCPTRGLFLIDSEWSASEQLDAWLVTARAQLRYVTA